MASAVLREAVAFINLGAGAVIIFGLYLTAVETEDREQSSNGAWCWCGSHSSICSLQWYMCGGRCYVMDRSQAC